MLKVQGKPFKQLKEDFIKLRSSYHYCQKQLNLAREARDTLSKELRLSKDKSSRLEAKLKNFKDSLDDSITKARAELKLQVQELSKSNQKLEKQVVRLNSTIQNLRKRAEVIRRAKYHREGRVKDLSAKLSNSEKSVKRLMSQVERLKGAKPKERVKIVKDKVFVTKTVKEPLPDKIRKLMSANTITDSRLNLLSVAVTLNELSSLTGLTLKQMIVLMEANNLNYFTLNNLTWGSSSVVKELEYRKLVMGDRVGKKRAVGWFITSKGKKVSEMLIKRLQSSKNKKKYFKE